jgi:hypothetical protein
VRATWWQDEQDEVMDDRAGARWRSSQEAWREAGPSTRGLVVFPQNHRRTVSWFGDGIRACREASKRRTRGGIAWLALGGRRGAAKAWPSDGKSHKHYINAPALVVSPVVELGVVESLLTPVGPDI